MTVADNARQIEELKKITDKLSRIVVGNGEPGMDENVREIRKDLDTFRDEVNKNIGVIQSDVRNLTNMLSNYTGQNPAIAYDNNNHPGRRESDTKPDGEADRVLSWFKDKILPGIVSKLIDTVIVVLIVMAFIHWEDIFK